MTKSKKQRLQDAQYAKDKNKLIVLGASIATILILVFAMAS